MCYQSLFSILCTRLCNVFVRVFVRAGYAFLYSFALGSITRLLCALVFNWVVNLIFVFDRFEGGGCPPWLSTQFELKAEGIRFGG